tara:strand:- start:511 stop:990 length:480 start_codon:yes stop_codon:yes gene_type:complete
MSQAFFPNYDSSARVPMSIEEIKASDVGSTSALAVSATNGGTFTPAALHFSGVGVGTAAVVLPASAGHSIVVYSINATTNNSAAFAGVFFPSGTVPAADLEDTWTFACNIQGPMFMDFSQPVVLPTGKALAAYYFAANSSYINLLSLRYSYLPVAGAPV